jgi:hypothetical protein
VVKASNLVVFLLKSVKKLGQTNVLGGNLKPEKQNQDNGIWEKTDVSKTFKQILKGPNNVLCCA